MKHKFLFIPLLLLFSACSIEVSELPCIFGPWKVLEINGKGASTTRFTAFTAGDNFNFQKNDRVIVSNENAKSSEIKFEFSDKGLRLHTTPIALDFPKVVVQGDTLFFENDSFRVKLARF